MGTIVIGFLTSFTYVISMFFSMQDLAELTDTLTGVPILELYRQATGSVPLATFLEFLICFTGLGCQIACHTWQARLCWSFSRDRGLPGSRYWSVVHPKLQIPFNAHAMSSAIVGVLGVLYLGSTTAFNAMVAACICLLYVSYIIPVICLLVKGRDNIPHGPFWLGKFGMFCNFVLIGWTIFSLVIYSFPVQIPVAGSSKLPPSYSLMYQS